MRYSFTGKGTNVSQALKDKAINKLSRLERIIPQDAEVNVTLAVVKSSHTVEVTIPLKKRILRAEVTERDFMTALDQAVDILEKQMIKLKDRLHDKGKRDVSFKEELEDMFSGYTHHMDDEEEEGGIVIKRSKKFALKPMDAEEAVMNMELLGHSFFVFRNAITDEINVVYKRKNNTYGLIEPEY